MEIITVAQRSRARHQGMHTAVEGMHTAVEHSLSTDYARQLESENRAININSEIDLFPVGGHVYRDRMGIRLQCDDDEWECNHCSQKASVPLPITGYLPCYDQGQERKHW